MAAESYWHRVEQELEDPDLGISYFRRIQPADALRGFALAELNRFALQLVCLGRHEEARALPASYIPELRKLLGDPTVVAQLASRPSVSLAFHLETLAVGSWIVDGKYDKAVLTRVVDQFDADPDLRMGRANPSRLTDALISLAELGDTASVEQWYMAWEKQPLSGIPPNLRFSSNPRHVIVQHVRAAQTGIWPDVLQDGLEKFATKARDWEKDPEPIYTVDLTNLSRIVFLCLTLRGERPTLEQLSQWVA